MTTNPYFLYTEDTIELAAEILGKGQFQALPILGGERVADILTTTDLINCMLSNCRDDRQEGGHM